MAGGSEIREFVIKARLDTSDAEGQARKLNDIFGSIGKTGGSGGGAGFEITGRAIENTARSAEKAQRSFVELNQAVELGQKAFGLLAKAGQFAIEQLEIGEKVARITQGFESLQAAAGAVADDTLTKLDAALGGTVDKLTIMQKANDALLLGLDPTKLDVLAQAATKLGAAVGKDATTAFGELVEGIGRGSPEILNNLGLIVKAEDAYRKFAATNKTTVNELTASQKLLAVQSEAYDQAAQKSAALEDPVRNAGTAYRELTKTLADSKNAFAEAVAGSDTLKDALTGLNIVAQTSASVISQTWAAFLGGEDSIDAIDAKLKLLKVTIQQNQELIAGGGIGGFLASNSSELGNALEDEARLKAKKDILEEKQLRKDLETELLASSDKIRRQREEDEAKAAAAAEAAGKKAEAAAKKHREEQERLAETINKQVFAFEQLGKAAEIDKLGTGLDKAIENLDSARFSNLSAQYETALTDAARKSLLEQNKEAVAAGKITAEQIESYATSVAKEEIAQRAEEYQRAVNEAFQGSVDFFTDIFTSSIDGTAQDLEDTFKDALKRVAIGFASQMAASIASELGVSGFGNINSAGGLGQVLASSLGFKGGGTQTLSDILGYGQQAFNTYNSFSGGSAAGSGAVDFGSTILGGSQGTTLVGSGVQYSTGYTAATTLGVAGLAYLGYEGGTNLYSNLTDNKKDADGGLAQGAQLGAAVGGIGTVAAAAYAGATIGSVVPVIGTIVGAAVGAAVGYIAGGAIGGDPQKAIEREARERVIDNIQDNSPLGKALTFQGVNGPLTLDETQFNLTDNRPDSVQGQAAALANPFAQYLSGGDNKLSSDVAAIFANATSDADNFNEVLVNTQALMEGLGLTVEDTKSGLLTAFLDGQLSLGAFGQDLQQLNLIAQESLVGPNSIADGLGIIAKNIDGEGKDSPRAALKGLELEFKALAAAGYDSTEEIASYFDSIGQSDVGDFFEEIKKLGVDSFDDIAGAIEKNPDLVYALAAALQNSSGAFSEFSTAVSDAGAVGSSAGTETADGFTEAERATQRATEAAKRYSAELDRIIEKSKQVAGLPSSGGSSDDDEDDGTTAGGEITARYRP